MVHVKKLENERQYRYYRDRNSRDRWGSNPQPSSTQRLASTNWARELS